MATRKKSRVTILEDSVMELPQPPMSLVPAEEPQRPSEPAQEPQIIKSEPSRNKELLVVFDAIARILAVRVLLFAAFLGSFFLYVAALYGDTHNRLYVAIIYDILVFIPIIYLYIKEKQG